MSGVGRRPELGSLGAGHLTNARQTNGSDLSLSDVLVTRSLGFRAGFGNYMPQVTGGAGRVGILKKMKKKNIPIQYLCV